jgi:hypothetical protein
MNRDDIIRIAREAGFEVQVQDVFNYRPQHSFIGIDEDLERLVKAIEQNLYYDGIHTCHAECQRPACVAVREAVKAELDRCVLILERLHERSNGQYNYYLHAAKVLKGEI